MHAFDLAFVTQPSAKSSRQPACDAKAAGYSCDRFDRSRPRAGPPQRVREDRFDRGGQRLCLRPPQSSSDGELEMESKGIPRRRLQHLAAACDISEELELLEDEPLETLRLECAIRELPFVVLRDRRELAICLLAMALWDELPRVELVREARQWGLPTAGDAEGLMAELVDALWTSLAEARGVPVRRLAPEVGVALVGKAARLESCSPERVEAEYRRLMRRRGLPVEPKASKQFHIELIVLALVLEEASLDQLKQECREAGLAGQANVSSEAAQRELLQRRLLGAALGERWEARGIPTARLGVESAIRVALRHEELEAMGLPELYREMEAMHVSRDDPGGRKEDEKELRERLKAATLWAELPVKHLQDECRDWGLLPASSNRGDLMEQLSLAGALTPTQVAMWEERGVPLKRLSSQRDRLAVVSKLQRLEGQSPEELRAIYREETGLPPEAGSVPEDSEQLLQRLRQLFSWKALPLNELRKECHDAGISHRSMGVSLSDEDKKGELVDRLILFRWAEHWGAQYPVNRFGTIRSANNFVETMQRLVGREVGLQAELATVSGLPQEAFGTMTRQELVENIKKVLLWKELPLDDLQEECLRLSLSWRVDQDGLSSHQQQQELCERLVMATCAKAWEAEGLPVKRLGNAEAAEALRLRWRALEGLGVEELRRQYADLRLPAGAPQPKVLEILPRLRQAALWAALPLGELQRECRQLGVDQGTCSREQALKALICGTWAPPDEANDASQDFWKSAAGKEAAGGRTCPKGPSSERIRKMAGHFQTLGLEPTAGVEELKRAYRKLILQYHPDKNQGAAQEEAARRFREVSEAYEALREFMKMGI